MKFPKGLEPIDSSEIRSDLSGVRNAVNQVRKSSPGFEQC